MTIILKDGQWPGGTWHGVQRVSVRHGTARARFGEA